MEPLCLQMSALTDSHFETVKKAVETVFSDVGFVVNHEVILERFDQAGGSVDYDRKLVRLPAALLWELAGQAPRQYRLTGMNGDSYDIGTGAVFKGAIVTDPIIADYPSGDRRKPYLHDVVRNTRIIQERSDVCFVGLMDYPVADDESPASRYRAWEAHLLNHAKPYAVYATSYDSFLEWLALGRLIKRGDELKGSGLFSVAIAVLSPLTLTRENCNMLIESIKYDFPLIPTVCPMAGSTSPYTFAGTLVQSIAENLIVLCAAQVMNPGNPFLFHIGPSVTDMRSGRAQYYTVDKTLWKMAGVSFAKRIGLPAAAETGGAYSSRYDMQSGAEGMLMTLSALMSGADVLCGAGSCLNANGLSSEFILTHYALLDAAAHLKKGYPMSELEQSVEAIREQGCGGNFLTDALTVEHLSDSEFFASPLFDETGEAGGGMTMLESAHAEAQRIDESFRSPVPEEVAEALRGYFAFRIEN